MGNYLVKYKLKTYYNTPLNKYRKYNFICDFMKISLLKYS